MGKEGSACHKVGGLRKGTATKVNDDKMMVNLKCMFSLQTGFPHLHIMYLFTNEWILGQNFLSKPALNESQGQAVCS